MHIQELPMLRRNLDVGIWFVQRRLLGDPGERRAKVDDLGFWVPVRGGSLKSETPHP